ncbi:hypothetical protein V1286_007229 [Bradyrhizobium algeriense]|uniref:DUF5343 domain-containing protein n=1 Tax=Bradyrhizobium algeriense TaxID=634784 RepID=A0ABU8BMH3_9BRAD
MAVTADKPCPYAPASAILDLVDRHRNRGLPPPINAEVLARASISESLIPRTLYALQALDLIDEAGRPTPTFEGIRLAPEAEYKKRLEDWLKGAYADVFAFADPSQDDDVAIRDAFRSYQPAGQRDRMITLFQGLCAAAGLAPEKPKAQQNRSVLRILPKPTAPAAAKRSSFLKAVARPTASTAHSGLPPALAGLLASLPAAGEGWTADDRAKFVTTFSAVLDFCFPIIKEDAAKQNGDAQ